MAYDSGQWFVDGKPSPAAVGGSSRVAAVLAAVADRIGGAT